MDYYGTIIQRERLNRGWSQEGLSKGICSVSYLSKIEKGRTTPSFEITKLLLERLGIQISEQLEIQAKEAIENAYELLFSGCFDELREFNKTMHDFSYTPYGTDYLLIKRLCDSDIPPLENLSEEGMNGRQLAMQRIIQGKYSEAVKLLPISYTYYVYGVTEYEKGNYTLALELLQTSYNLAADEGTARLMLISKAIIGNCYCNQLDYENTMKHYDIAKRLAKAMRDEKLIQEINYNIASMQIEQGEYEKAYAYLKTVASPGVMTLHKLAICCEKIDKTEEALCALASADNIAEASIDRNLAAKMCNIVKFRVEHKNYLNFEEYGTLLISAFEEMKKSLPIGYASFHIPWILEWYQHTRQYKKAYALLLDFPNLCRLV